MLHIRDVLGTGAKKPATVTHAQSRSKKGKRDDLDGVYFRSRWEANYARYLNFLKAQGTITSWAYEEKTFWFEAIKTGTRSFKPDFRVTFPSGRVEWHEVKGWMDDKSRVRLERMAKFYPEEKIVLIERAWFSQMRKSGSFTMIPHWEHGETPSR